MKRSGKFMWDYGYLCQITVWPDDYTPAERAMATKYFRNDLVRGSLRIADGQVLADEQSYQVAGLVAPNGIIRVVVAEGGRSASGVGKLSGNNGKGEWRTSTGQCAGQWTAVRRSNAEY